VLKGLLEDLVIIAQVGNVYRDEDGGTVVFDLAHRRRASVVLGCHNVHIPTARLKIRVCRFV